MTELTRPIIGIENRTAQEVLDIMRDRFTRENASSKAEIEGLRMRVDLLERTLGSATAQLEFLGVKPDGPTLRGYYEVLSPAALGSKP